jgi:hypothetical protein
MSKFDKERQESLTKSVTEMLEFVGLKCQVEPGNSADIEDSDDTVAGVKLGDNIYLDLLRVREKGRHAGKLVDSYHVFTIKTHPGNRECPPEDELVTIATTCSLNVAIESVIDLIIDERLDNYREVLREREEASQGMHG